MKKRNFLLILVLPFITTLTLLGCGSSGSKDLPVKTINFEADGTGFIQYYTNDKANLNIGKIFSTGTPLETMTTLETQLKKISGQNRWGFGIVFCFKDKDNFYRLLIHEDARYQVTKKLNGEYPSSQIIPWTDSSALKKGYNIINTIKVIYENKQFNIYFNGIYVTSFTDDSFTGGDHGFYVAIADNENFPNTPVDVRFKQQIPAYSPSGYRSFITESISNQFN